MVSYIIVHAVPVTARWVDTRGRAKRRVTGCYIDDAAATKKSAMSDAGMAEDTTKNAAVTIHQDQEHRRAWRDGAGPAKPKGKQNRREKQH